MKCKILYACCPNLSLVIKTQFSSLFLKCALKQKLQKKIFYFGGSRLFKVIDVNTTKTFLEPRWSGLKLLKSKFKAKNFIRRLSWFYFNHFGTFTPRMFVAARNRGKITNGPNF